MATLKEARQALAAQVRTAITDTDVDVLAFDPPDVVSPLVTVATAGVSPTSWRFTIRIYVDAGQSEQAQDLLDDLLNDVDLLLEPTTPRSSWDWEFDDARNTFLMVSTVEFDRSDF